MDGGGRDLAEADAAHEALVDVLLHGAEGDGQRRLPVEAGGLEEVDLLLAAAQLGEGGVDGAPDLLGRAVEDVRALGRVADGALDGEDDLVGVLGVLCEVALEQGRAVVAGRGAVDLAAVPEVGARVEGGFHAGEGDLVGGRVGAPRET